MATKQRSTFNKAIGKSVRSARFREESAYYWGEQYDHLPEAHTQEAAGKSLREKKPATIARWTARTVNNVNSYLFGVSQIPNAKVTNLYDADGVPVPDAELTDAQRGEIEELNALIGSIRRRSRLNSSLLELGRNGLLHGTVGLAAHSLPDSDRVWCEVLELADAYPKFASEDRELAEASDLRETDLIELDEYWVEFEEDIDGETKTMLHRRFWDTEKTTVYVPIDLDGKSPSDVTLSDYAFTEDAEKTHTHELGFVPVVWIQNIRVTNDQDGAPLVLASERRLEDEVNFTLSQSGAGVRYNANPKMVLSNVSNMDTKTTLQSGPGKSINLESWGSGPEAKAELLEMSGGGQQAVLAYVTALDKLYQQVTRSIEHDPEKAVGALSGTAIERLMQPLISLVGSLRDNYGAGIARWFEMQLYIEKGSWHDVEIIWPSVIEPTFADLAPMANTLLSLHLEGLITLQTVIETLAPFFSIDDVTQYLDDLLNDAAAGGTASTAATAASNLNDPGLFSGTTNATGDDDGTQ